jgi:NAD-dependent SIR2 family protein deacetylase
VLQAKVDALARLVEASQHCLVYSGAGISTSSGISDYATRAETSSERPRLRSPYEAQPTLAHRALVALHDEQLVRCWVQQNHDGLPQKAGLPQHCINEIHGAWYDPSNPVVAMNGSLRNDLFAEMLAWEQRTDLTLSLGTSMCGMNSDRVFTTVAKKGKASFRSKSSFRSMDSSATAAAIGGVIINRQQTQFDDLACLRIFADLDEVMVMLLRSLSLHRCADDCIAAMQTPRNFYVPYAATAAATAAGGAGDVFPVPYLPDGSRHPSRATRMLDLREGSKVRITGGPYAGDCGEVLGKNREGHYRVQFRHLVGITRRPFESVLGCWWVEAAVLGSVDTIPVVNIED